MVLPIEKFLSLVLSRNAFVTTPYYPISVPLYVKWLLMGG